MSLPRLTQYCMLFFLAAACTGARAQASWPTRPITLVVPYAAGGYTDLTGRITARFLENALGQSVIVDTRAGAGGIVGSDFVARSAPDGYTLCMCSSGAITIAPVAQTVSYDPLRGFTPIGIVNNIPLVLIVNPTLPAKSLPEFIAYAKANPNKLNYGSSGVGGLMNYAVQLFQVRTDTRMTHIPYKGGAPATLAVVANEVDLSFTNMTDALPQLAAGTVRALAITSAARNPLIEHIPTVQEEGVSNYAVETWNGIMGPKGLPASVVAKLSAALHRMASDRLVHEAFTQIGATAQYTTPEAFQTFIVDELAQWKRLVTEFNELEMKS